MNDAQRDAVRSNAKYLANVRPIDPEEIYQYVNGQPHPAAVRQVLRESALALDLIEQADGTFIPVPDAPVVGSPGPVRELPNRYDDRLATLLSDTFGPQWAEGETGERLRNRLRELKDEYFHQQSVTYDQLTAFAYAIYHLADFYAAIQYVLADLIEQALLNHQLRVVDVGAGVGGPALGLVDALPKEALIDYRAVEPSEPARHILSSLLAETGPNIHSSITNASADDYRIPAECDLILFGNVLSELPSPVNTVSTYLDHLSSDGAAILLAPADRETSTALRRIEREFTPEYTVYSPTVRLWPDAEPTDQCWSFARRQPLEIPDVQHRLDTAGSGSGEFVNVDVQYSYSILRRDGIQRITYRPDRSRVARLAETEEHVTDRIDCVAIKLSPDLGDEHPLFLIGDGSQQVDHYAVLTRETSLNRSLLTADYGDLLRLEHVLALWNDDEAAYNLVVDNESVIDHLGP